MKKIIYILLFVFGITSSPLIFAAESSTGTALDDLKEEAKETGEEFTDIADEASDFVDSIGETSAACKENNLGNYFDYILTARTEKERLEYFEDLIVRSYCQVSDIIDINTQLTELRELMRNASYDCQSIEDYKVQYTKLLMEVYFIRHINEVPAGTLNDFQKEQIEEKKEKKLEILKTKMYDLFVIKENDVDSDTLDEYFEEWSNKYDDKIIKYFLCDEGPWAEVVESVNDFTETWSEIVETMKGLKDIKTPQKPLFDEVDVDVDDAIKIGKNIAEFFKKFKEERKENVENKKTVEEAIDESGSFESVLEALSSSEIDYDVDIASMERLAKYQVLYSEGGSRVSEDFQKLISEMNEVIKETNTKEIKEVLKYVKQIDEKQCKG